MTYCEAICTPPLPFSGERCDPDSTGGSSRRLSFLDGGICHASQHFNPRHEEKIESVHGTVQIRQLRLFCEIEDILAEKVNLSLKAFERDWVPEEIVKHVCNCA